MVMMQYLSELIHAQMDCQRPGNIPEGISFDDLVAIAHKHHIDVLILGALLKTDLSEKQRAAIKPYVLQNTMKSMVQMRCLRELSEKFENEQIYYQVLKGSVLKQLYPFPEYREMSDIDIMIYDNMDRAKKAAEEMGFTLYKSVNHHDIYMKEPMLILELHHALYDKDVDRAQYDYYEDAKRLNINEGKEYTLEFGVEDFYVYMISHIAKHFFETGCGIRNILDIYYYRRLYESSWDESSISEGLEKCGLIVFEDRISTLSAVWLGGKESDAYSEMLFNYMLECGIYGRVENGLWGRYAMSNRNKNSSHKRYIRRWYYFPPIAYMERDFAWLRRHPYLILFAWSYRCIHGLFSKHGREKRRMLINVDNEEVNMMKDIYMGMQLKFRNN